MQDHTHLGSTRVRRSAHIDVDADLVAYIGICKGAPDGSGTCPRPVRLDIPAGADASLLDRYITGRCPDCAREVKLEKLFAVHSDLDCADDCKHAFSTHCTCGCDGTNHSRIWALPLRSSELVQGALRDYHKHLQDVEQAREIREQIKKNEHEVWRGQRACADSVADLGRALASVTTMPSAFAPIMNKIHAGDLTNGDCEDGIAILVPPRTKVPA